MTEIDDEFGDWLTESGIQPEEWTAGEWDRDTAIDFSFIEGNEWAEAEAEKRELERIRELIENPEYREQASKVSEEVLARQSKMLEQGRNPAGYYDDDYDDDDYYDDDNEDCYPSLDPSVSCYDDDDDDDD